MMAGACLSIIFFLVFTTGNAQKSCLALPDISDSTNNATGAPPFSSGTSVQFTCEKGYQNLNTVDALKCVDGKWEGNFGCIKRKCFPMNPLKKGIFPGPINNEVDSVVKIACEDGYRLEGSDTLTCRSDGQWNPSLPPECKIVTCGTIGEIHNASITYVDGKDYGSSVIVTCDDGYLKSGWWHPKCRADGTWDETPVCTPSQCGSHPSLNSSCIYDTSVSEDGNALTIACQENSADVSVTETENHVDYCTDGEWHHRSMGCFCDCKLTVDVSRIIAKNLNDGKFLKHNSELDWECRDGYENKTDSITCFDGKTNTAPECVLADKKSPQSTANNLVEELDLIISVLSLVLSVLLLGGVAFILYKRLRRGRSEVNQNQGLGMAESARLNTEVV